MEPTWEEVTDAELAVLQVLWDRGPSTIGVLADALYPGGTDAHYATVQVLLRRLEEKGHVQRDRSSRAHVFNAATPREVLVGHRLRAMAEKLCGGLLVPLPILEPKESPPVITARPPAAPTGGDVEMVARVDTDAPPRLVFKLEPADDNGSPRMVIETLPPPVTVQGRYVTFMPTSSPP